VAERGQASVEYVALVAAVALTLVAAAAVAQGAAAQPDDGASVALARRHTPVLVLERGGDDLVPVDFRRCRRDACARLGAARPVLFVHAVRRPPYTYLEYWAYLPSSRTAHTGIPALDGAHADDWEGAIVKLRGGRVVGARVSSHLGWNGRRPWWELRRGDWAPYRAPVYRASGSHASSFARGGIDVAGDAWGGDGVRLRPALVPAKEALAAGRSARFDPATVPPWEKAVWRDPEAPITGRPGDRASYARFARWWAAACLPCRLVR
jgi:hypothetical protein